MEEIPNNHLECIEPYEKMIYKTISTGDCWISEPSTVSPENGWLEDDPFLSGLGPIFRGQAALSCRTGPSLKSDPRSRPFCFHPFSDSCLQQLFGGDDSFKEKATFCTSAG